METVASGTEAGRSGATELGLDTLLPMLTTDVIVHTWDLARAIDVDPQLDQLLCELSFQAALSHDEQLRASGMFGPAVPVPADADAGSRLVAFFGQRSRVGRLDDVAVHAWDTSAGWLTGATDRCPDAAMSLTTMESATLS